MIFAKVINMNDDYLKWKDVELVEYEDKYFDYVYELYQDYNSRYLFTSNLNIISKKKMWEDIKKKMNYTYHQFKIIINTRKQIPVGFIYSYDYNLKDNYLYIAICIEEKERNGVVGAEAGMIFLNYLFKSYPIRKVYCTVYEYNRMSMSFLKNAGFKTEGILKEHKYFDGKYYDMNVLTFYREDLPDLTERLKFNQ